MDKIVGRVWKFGDDINTDLIFPNTAFQLPQEEQAKLVFQINRPGWAEEVKPGDIIIGGRNFGTGSSRPAPRVLKQLKVGALVANSINGLFFRNAVNFGLPALQCPQVYDTFEEGDIAEIDLEAATVINRRTGQAIKGSAIPENIINLMAGGGLFRLLKSEGFLE